MDCVCLVKTRLLDLPDTFGFRSFPSKEKLGSQKIGITEITEISKNLDYRSPDLREEKAKQ